VLARPLTCCAPAAIYFISPCERSVRQLIDDFAGPLQMYKRAHVFFSNRACLCPAYVAPWWLTLAAQRLRSVC
jgi:hypothetical protein